MTLPDRTTPLTESERWDRASDWSDFRKDYGVSPDPDVLAKEHRAFCAGWDARRDAANQQVSGGETDA